MSAKNKMDQQNLCVWKAVGAALVGSLCCFFAGAAIFAQVMVRGNCSGSAASQMAVFALAFGTFSASWIAVKILHHGVLLCVAVSFLVYGLLPILGSVIFGSLEISALLVLRIVLLLVCGLMGGILGMKTAKRKKVH